MPPVGFVDDDEDPTRPGRQSRLISPAKPARSVGFVDDDEDPTRPGRLSRLILPDGFADDDEDPTRPGRRLCFEVDVAGLLINLSRTYLGLRSQHVPSQDILQPMHST
jgi:hypothetical protein